MQPVFFDQGNGKAVFSGMLMNDAGQLEKQKGVLYTTMQNGKRVNMPVVINSQDAPAMGFILFQQSANNQQNMFKNNPAVIPVERVGGAFTVARTEMPQGGRGTGQTLVATFDTTGVAPLTNTKFLLGDGGGALAQILALPVLPGGFVVTGDYNNTPLATYNSRVRAGLQIRLKGDVTFRVYDAAGNPAPALYGQNFLSLVTINDVKGTQVLNMPFDFNKGYRGNQLDLSVRSYNDFDFSIGEPTALYFNIPQGYKVSVSFNIYSASIARDMILSQNL